jgi:spermidine/putrescine-binding protein
MSDNTEQLNILAPLETKSKMDALHRTVERAAGHPMSRRSALGLGGLMLLSACGSTSTGQANPGTGTSSSAGGLAGKPLENHLEIFNWSEYDDPSTYYSSNDELLAKLNAGGTTYDIIAPSQNAVAQLIQENKLLAMDQSLLPNLKHLDPKFLKASYDPTGQYHVIKDYGITLIYYNNQIITEHPQTMHDFYALLPKYHSLGRTNLLDGAEEVVPLALMALGLDPNTGSKSDFDAVTKYLMSFRKGVTTISSSSYIDDAIAGKIILGQGWNGDVRRIVQGRKKQGDITAVLLHDASGPTTGASPRPRRTRWPRTPGSTGCSRRRRR